MSTDIYFFKIARHNDPMIAARPNEKKKTRSATIRPGPAASAGSHTGHGTDDSGGSGRPLPGQILTGRHDRLPAKDHGRRLHPHGGRGAYLPKDGGPSQDQPESGLEGGGLSRIPSKGATWRAYGMIPEPYLREVHTRIIGDVMVTSSLAGDSTGYSSNRFVRWFSIRHDQVRLKRGWVKLHSIVDVSTRTVLDYLVTDGYTSDITGLWPMLGRIEEGTGFFCLDSAYLARKICDAISDKGIVPRIRPKSNTVCKNGGS